MLHFTGVSALSKCLGLTAHVHLSKNYLIQIASLKPLLIPLVPEKIKKKRFCNNIYLSIKTKETNNILSLQIRLVPFIHKSIKF